MKKEIILRLALLLLLLTSFLSAADGDAVPNTNEINQNVVIEVPRVIGVEVILTDSDEGTAEDPHTTRRMRYRVFHNNQETMKIAVGATKNGMKDDIVINGKVETPLSSATPSIGIIEIIDGKVSNNKSLDAFTNLEKGFHEFQEFNYDLPADMAGSSSVTITYTICN